jgi:hypothetical protein
MAGAWRTQLGFTHCGISNYFGHDNLGNDTVIPYVWEKRNKMSTPQLRPLTDLKNELDTFSKEFHEWYTKCVAEEGYEPKDGAHHSYERLIEFLYGKEYWDWINGLELEEW